MKYTLLFVFGLLIGSVGAMDTEVTPGDVAVVPLGVVGGSSEHSLLGDAEGVPVAIALMVPPHLVEEDLRMLPWSMDRVEQALRGRGHAARRTCPQCLITVIAIVLLWYYSIEQILHGNEHLGLFLLVIGTIVGLPVLEVFCGFWRRCSCTSRPSFILRADRKHLAKIIPERDGDSLNQPALLVIEQLGRDVVIKGGVTVREHEGRVIFINSASLKWHLRKCRFTVAQQEMVWRRIKCFADAFKDLSFVDRNAAWTGLLNVFLGEDAPPSLEDFLDEACLARPHVLGPTHAAEEVAIIVGGTPRGARVAPGVPGAAQGRLAWTDPPPSR